MSLGGFDATNVIQSFFHLFATWPWPQAVALVEIDPTEKFQQQQLVQLASTLNLLSWNPEKYPGDSMHVSFFQFNSSRSEFKTAQCTQGESYLENFRI